jgi:hypothetical protein
MPIPALNEHGLLPEGIHDCTLAEIEARFGRFQHSDRRPSLWRIFKQFADEIAKVGVVTSVLIDGSFVTAKADPNDIDLILVLPPTHDFDRDLSPAEYNVLSARAVKRRHKLDILVASSDSDQYRRYLRLFQQVRLEPERLKGMLRIKL